MRISFKIKLKIKPNVIITDISKKQIKVVDSKKQFKNIGRKNKNRNWIQIRQMI
jgi:hypothetical protein